MVRLRYLLWLQLLLLLSSGTLGDSEQPVPKFQVGFMGQQTPPGIPEPHSTAFRNRMLAIRAAFNVACTQVNENPEFNSHFELECVSSLLDGSVSNTASQCVGMVERHNVVAIVGPLQSEHSAACADALARFKVPQISPSSSRSDLGDRGRYPGFFRTCPPDHCTALAMIDILRYMRVDEVGLLCERSLSQYATDFLVDAGSAGINVITQPCVTRAVGSEMQHVVDDARRTGRAINLIAFTPQSAWSAMLTIEKSGMARCPFTWMLHDGSVIYDASKHPGLSGAVGVLPSRGAGPLWQEFYTAMDQELAKLGMDASEFPNMLYTSRTNDAVLAIAHALLRELAGEPTNTSNQTSATRDLNPSTLVSEIDVEQVHGESDAEEEAAAKNEKDDLRPSRYLDMAHRVKQQLEHMDAPERGFEGSTLLGPMYFRRWSGPQNTDTCWPPARYDVVNQQNLTMVQVGLWTAEAGLSLRANQLVWSNGRTASEMPTPIEMSSHDSTCPQRNTRVRWTPWH